MIKATTAGLGMVEEVFVAGHEGAKALTWVTKLAGLEAEAVYLRSALERGSELNELRKKLEEESTDSTS